MGYGSRDENEQSFQRTATYYSEDRHEREQAEAAREREVEAKRARIRTETSTRTHAKPMEQDRERIIPSLARNTITIPPSDADHVFIPVVDNSGSNHAIAHCLRNAGRRLCGGLHAMSPNSVIAFQFASDHCDGPNMIQEVDYCKTNNDGEPQLRASLANIRGADGKDLAEAFECALPIACRYNFGNVPKQRRHLFLITDEIAHGMGHEKWNDMGCPDKRHWRAAVREVEDTFGTFQVVATGTVKKTFELQKQFISDPKRVRYDLVDLATNNLSEEERCRLVIPAVLFLMARCLGQQYAERYLMLLYPEWLERNQYKQDTDKNARKQIRDLAMYLEVSDEARNALLKRIFAD